MTRRNPRLRIGRRVLAYVVAMVFICTNALMGIVVGVLFNQPLLAYGAPLAAAVAFIYVIVQMRRPNEDDRSFGEGDERTHSIHVRSLAFTGGALEVTLYAGFIWSLMARSELALVFGILMSTAAVTQLAASLYLRHRS